MGITGSQSSQQCSIVMNLPDSPSNIYNFNIENGQITPLLKEDNQALPEDFKLKVEIHMIPSTDEVKVPTIVNLPENLSPETKLPVIVWIHGGPAESSKAEWHFFKAIYLLNGYAYVEPNVRGSLGYGRAWETADDIKGRMKSIEDMRAVGEWVRKQPWADPDRLVVMGGSYGGYMVLMGLAMQSDIWAAGVDICGFVDLTSMMETTLGPMRQMALTEFGNPETDREFMDSVSPVNHVSKIVDPLFVYQGRNDPVVPITQADMIVQKLQEKGNVVEYMIADDEGHSMDKQQNRSEFAGQSLRFLEEVFGSQYEDVPK